VQPQPVPYGVTPLSLRLKGLFHGPPHRPSPKQNLAVAEAAYAAALGRQGSSSSASCDIAIAQAIRDTLQANYDKALLSLQALG
jgi:hypothetical protein